MSARRMKLAADFKVGPRHLRVWAHDLALTVAPIFERRAQTPLIVPAPSLRALAEPARKALRREFGGDVTFASTIPANGFAAVAFTIRATRDRCAKCGEAAKTIETIWAAFADGRPVPRPREHATAVPCPACGFVATRTRPASKPALKASKSARPAPRYRGLRLQRRIATLVEIKTF